MRLLTKTQHRSLLSNDRESIQDAKFDPLPVVKLFTPDGAATWLLAWIDPPDPGTPNAPARAFGLCDLGLGFPALGYVLIEALEASTGHLGLAVERDRWFIPTQRLSGYARDARQFGRVHV